MSYHYSIRTGINRIRTKLAVSLSALVFVVGATGSLAIFGTAYANGASNPAACADGKLLVNVNYTLTNDFDSATDGHAWANDTINRHLQVWQAGAGQYCAVVNDTGSFVTFAGTSPNGSGSVDAGVTGRINGGYVTTDFTGTFAPSTYATHGNLGTFDLECTDAYTCPGVYPSFLSYFSSTGSWDLATWAWDYHTAQNGDMSQSSTTSYNGDIKS